MPQLVFVRWQGSEAVYKDGERVYYGAAMPSAVAPWDLLKTLGYECRSGGSVPDSLPVEFNAVGSVWAPPKLLSQLETQQAAYRGRLRRERIAALEKELAELK
jgi:hypothetical protein